MINFLKIKLYFYYNVLKFKKRKVQFLSHSSVDLNCDFEGYNSVGERNRLSRCKIGIGSYTGSDVRLNYTNIGRFCSIASNVKNVYGDHPVAKFVSTHPAFFSIGHAAGFTLVEKQLFPEKSFFSENVMVEIGNDVWLGENVTLLGKIKIGNGAIIGANSLVTKDVEPYSINIGSPAKLIRYRFTADEICKLEDYKWWDKPFSWIKDNSKYFSDINYFKTEFLNKNA